jgi:hypothetical protein
MQSLAENWRVPTSLIANVGLDILGEICSSKRLNLTTLHANMDCFLLEQRMWGFLFVFGMFVFAKVL